MQIILEYKDQGRSGACGRIAVWLFDDPDKAKKKLGELAKNGLPLTMYEAKPTVLFH